MDAFYASIEQRDHPEYCGRPIAVGYSGARGVVAAASYEARRYGVHSAMSSKMALRKCPYLTFLPARFSVYKEVSQQIQSIFLDYTDLMEPLSLDEAFLDVTVNKKNMLSATIIANEIRQRIFESTQLTASAGVSYNKFLAKMASDQNKPNGIFVVEPHKAEKFLEQLPIERFYGVGRVTAEKMRRMNITNGFDLKQWSEGELLRLFGKAGRFYYQNVRGIDLREVMPNRIRKSIGAENTFAVDSNSLETLEEELRTLADEVMARINKNSFSGRCITLKVKYADFKLITRSKTLPLPVADVQTLFNTAFALLCEIDLLPKVRLLGLSVKKNDVVEWRDALQLEFDFAE